VLLCLLISVSQLPTGKDTYVSFEVWADNRPPSTDHAELLLCGHLAEMFWSG
jgi:hypothetical protein